MLAGLVSLILLYVFARLPLLVASAPHSEVIPVLNITDSTGNQSFVPAGEDVSAGKPRIPQHIRVQVERTDLVLYITTHATDYISKWDVLSAVNETREYAMKQAIHSETLNQFSMRPVGTEASLDWIPNNPSASGKQSLHWQEIYPILRVIMGFYGEIETSIPWVGALIALDIEVARIKGGTTIGKIKIYNTNPQAF